MAEDPFNIHSGYPEKTSDSQSLALPATPKIIGPYRIETLLQRGGMSLLYLGTHPETKEPVTIKVLSPKFLSNPEVVKRFLNEAEIIAMADHPNIVKLFGYGEWASGLYIAMEFIQGISLRQYLLQNPASLKKSLEIILDVSYALCHLHTHGVIHRDLKPENILITESGVVKVIDFGIAQLLTDHRDFSVGSKNRIIGTPIYMSPEQKENPENVSYPSDIYSLGIIAYELILGKLCHGQVHLSLMPKGMQKILSKTLQFKPEDRYHDIVDFISDITAYLHSATLQKEKKPGDKISELSEDLQLAKGWLLPNAAPDWPHISVGIASHKSFDLWGLYYDFLTLPNQEYGIILCESSKHGAEGILHVAAVKGIVKALKPYAGKPAELASALNAILVTEPVDQPYGFSYLVLAQKEQHYRFISCHLSHLYSFSRNENMTKHIHVDNLSLGIDSHIQYHHVTLPWPKDNILLFATFSPPFPNRTEENEIVQPIVDQILQENALESPQKIVDLIQRKIRLSSLVQLKDRAFILICIKQIYTQIN